MADLPKLLECNQCWVSPCDDPDNDSFDHRSIVFTRGQKYFHARDSRRTGEVDLHTIDSEEIPIEHFRARFDPQFLRAPDSAIHSRSVYLKEPRLVVYGTCTPNEQQNFYQSQLREVQIYEKIRQRPHPNIAVYYGCAVKDGLVRGLCLERYYKTLGDLHRENAYRPGDQQRFFEDVKRGIEHLHSLDLVHGDLNPANIMVDYGCTKAVLVDFDSCRAVDQVLTEKVGTPFWLPPIIPKTADKETDRYGLEMLKAYLLGDGNSEIATDEVASSVGN